jgi:hypothetical protein
VRGSGRSSTYPYLQSAWKWNSPKFAQLRPYAERYSYVQDREMFLLIHKNLIIHSRRGRLVGPGLYGAPAL